jgi:hypothetical protein
MGETGVIGLEDMVKMWSDKASSVPELSAHSYWMVTEENRNQGELCCGRRHGNDWSRLLAHLSMRGWESSK